MKVDRMVRPPKTWDALRTRVLMVCFFFVLGMLLGRVIHGTVSQADHLRLQEYMLQYARLSGQTEDPAASILSVLWAYLRYPLLIFLSGFTALGIVLIPTVWLVQGCTMAFSAACFASALGRSGVLLALAAFGIRSLFVFPCSLLLSAWSLDGPLRCIHVRGENHRKKKPLYQPNHYLRFAVCLAVLLIGVIAELTVVPKLLQLVLAGIS